MLKLGRIDLVGFKSFFHRASLDFPSGITGVVGPNGCGKSNICDAIAWVLGEQSARSLRGEKMSDVIFGGTGRLKPLGMAEVKLRFETDNGFPAAQEGVVEVGRRLFRSGDSEYLLNGERCRRKDIQELFMDTGLGMRAYSVIEQGKIDVVLSYRPVERRVLIEEVAGITRYKSRRRAAQLRLESTENNLLRVGDIIREVERQMNSLKRQAARARRYSRLQTELRGLRKVLLLRNHNSLKEELAKVESDLVPITNLRSELSATIARLEASAEKRAAAMATQEESLKVLRDECHDLDLQIERNGSRRQHLDELETETESSIEDGVVRTQEAEERIRELDSTLRLVVTRLSEAETEHSRQSEILSNREGRAGDLRSEVGHLSENLGEKRRELYGTVQSLGDLRGQLDRKLADLRVVEADRDRSLKEEAALCARKDELDQILASDRLEIEDLERSKEAIESSIRGDLEEIGKLHVDREEIEKSRTALREERLAHEKRIEAISELERNREGYREGVRAALLSEGRLKELLGFHGVLADHIEVEPGFEVVVGHALEQCLQSIVVEDSEAAKSAVSLLEEDDAERCLLAVRQHDSNTQRLDIEGRTGYLGPLEHFVRVTPPYQDLLHRMARRIHVVEDLATADSLSREFPEYSFLTRRGEALLPGGLFAGGRSQDGSGGIVRRKAEKRRLESRMKEIDRETEPLQEKLAFVQNSHLSAEARLEELRENRAELDRRESAFRVRLDQNRGEREKLFKNEEIFRVQRERLDGDREVLCGGRDKLEQEISEREEAQNRLEQELESLDRGLTEKRRLLQQYETELIEVRRLFMDATERLGEQKAVHRSATEEQERNREAVKALHDEAEGLREKLSSIQRERTQLLADYERDRERRGSLMDRLADAESGLLRMREESAGSAEELKELRTKRDQVQESETSLEMRRREISLERRSLAEKFLEELGEVLESASPDPEAPEGETPELQKQYVEIKEKRDKIGPVNLGAIEEFGELEERYQFLTTQRNDIQESISSIRKTITDIDRVCKDRFAEAFETVNREFQEVFGILFNGGHGELRLLEPDNILESGIEIITQPPGKKIQTLSLLSGGEKALTAIALLMALFRIKPSPFCLMDEVDAPLDDANIGRFIALLHEMKERTQFILITHNKRTMAAADLLYGVTMEESGVSKLVSVQCN